MSEENKIECPICRGNATYTPNDEEIYRDFITCDCCGTFDYAKENNSDYLKLSELEKINLRTYLYLNKDKNQGKYIPKILKSKKAELFGKINAPKNLLEKIDVVLLDINKNTKCFGDNINFVKLEKIDYKEPRINQPKTCLDYYCKDEQELENILNELQRLDYIRKESKENNWDISITSKGLQYAKSLSTTSSSEQVFVAMWFDNETKDLWNKIKQSIEGNPNEDKNSSNYGANYKALRIDEKEHTNFIPSEIISEIKRSKFMIADLTGYRGGVYYEAGYAEGLGIPVILTCNNDWFEDKRDNDKIIKNGVHFDLKQKNILLWKNDNLTEFQRKLVARIGEVVGFNEK